MWLGLPSFNAMVGALGQVLILRGTLPRARDPQGRGRVGFRTPRAGSGANPNYPCLSPRTLTHRVNRVPVPPRSRTATFRCLPPSDSFAPSRSAVTSPWKLQGSPGTLRPFLHARPYTLIRASWLRRLRYRRPRGGGLMV